MSSTKDELIEYKESFQNELTNILSYWIKYSVDEKSNSFYGAVDLDNKPVLTANKSCVLNSRILWTFSAAAAKYNNNQDYSRIANLAYNVLQRDFLDTEYGGYFMELSPENKVVSSIKNTYAQAFVLYSMCKYYEFNPSEEVLSEIKKLFYKIEEKTKDQNHLGYKEAFTREWNLIEENRMADNNEPKSMNTHLHILEAYAALYKIWKGERVKKRLTELMNIFLKKIIRDSSHLGIFFNDIFNEVESSKGICSFGHDIEASWLLWEAAEILNDPVIKENTLQKCIKMVDAVERVGVDKDGGLFLESTRYGSHVRTNKHWWPQAENLVGFMNAYYLTGDLKYWETVKLSWDFINKYVIDHEKGEWYTKVNRLGVPYLTEPKDDPSPYYRNNWKIDPWKCPYHNGRAMMELIDRINKLLEKD
ncbi:MAG: AGE family epimerase/isomerase [Bacteroidota bacterium]